MTIALSDKQHVNTQSIEKPELLGADLLITYKNGDHIKVHGPGTADDANLLDEVREREKLSYSVFRTAKSK